MAGIFRGQGSSIARALLPALLFVVFAIPAALAQLYEQPVLIIDPGTHTAPIKDVSVDAAGRIAVTGSWDKTIRVWSLTDGELLRTIRMPAGPGDIGKIYAVAVHPDGTLVAADSDCHAARREMEAMLEERFGLDHTTLQVDHAGGLLEIEPRGTGSGAIRPARSDGSAPR